MDLMVQSDLQPSTPEPHSPWLLRDFPRCKRPYRWVIRSFS